MSKTDQPTTEWKEEGRGGLVGRESAGRGGARLLERRKVDRWLWGQELTMSTRRWSRQRTGKRAHNLIMYYYFFLHFPQEAIPLRAPDVQEPAEPPPKPLLAPAPHPPAQPRPRPHRQVLQRVRRVRRLAHRPVPQHIGQVRQRDERLCVCI